MAGRRVLLILSLVLALRTTAGAQSLPLIVQISPTANIGVITTTLAATVIDSRLLELRILYFRGCAGSEHHFGISRGATTVSFPVRPSALRPSLRRLRWFGLCEPVGLPIPYRRAPSTSIRRTPVTKTSLATAGLTCPMQSSRTRDRNNLESGPSPSGRGRRDSQRAPG